jgi:DNA mismatch endonuclease (patch repair protein)
MVDSLTSVERSKRMSLIRSQHTRPELLVRQAIHRAGYRFRLHRKDLPGKPDLVLPARKLAVFVNGCFWHGHKCTIGHIPKTNSEFWIKKIQRNRSRDARSILLLRQSGWKVALVWECRLTPKRAPLTIQLLMRVIRSRDVVAERRRAA